jgi:hypothetical protein
MGIDRPLPSTLAVTKVVTGANPAAGAEISVSVPAGKSWHLLAVKFTLVTSRRSRTGGPRSRSTTARPSTGAGASGRPGRVAHAQLPVPALAHREVDRSTTFNEMYEPLDEDMLLGPGSRIKTVTSAIQAADDYGAPVLYVVEYGSTARSRIVRQRPRRATRRCTSPPTTTAARSTRCNRVRGS